MFKEFTPQLDIGYKNIPERLYNSKIATSGFIVKETQIKVGSELIWL
ncbi:MAG TPA: hypothetical protein VIY08_07750 [Candidatus Nitrosocosmicus sp.]